MCAIRDRTGAESEMTVKIARESPPLVLGVRPSLRLVMLGPGFRGTRCSKRARGRYRRGCGTRPHQLRCRIVRRGQILVCRDLVEAVANLPTLVR